MRSTGSCEALPIMGRTTSTTTGRDVEIPDAAPRWGAMALATGAAGVLLLPLVTQGVALWAYAFPLFGIGIVYVGQYRPWFTRPWWITLVAITPLSVVALALDWPFSGHVLWNVLFIGHDALRIRSRRWLQIFGASLVHLVVMKALFQTTRDLLGAVLSGALAIAMVLVLWRVGRPARDR